MKPRFKKRRKRSIPTGVGEEMTAVLRRLGTGNREIHPEIWSRWHQIVGSDLAIRTLPRRLNGKTLVLAVASSAWMHELSYLREMIVARIAEEVGPGIVRSVRLILDTAMPVRPSLPPPASKIPEPDPPLPIALSDAIERVEDSDLREQIRKAAKASISE